MNPKFKVAELLYPDRTWNVDLLWDVAEPADVEQVLQITITSQVANDQLIWLHTDKGRVAVRSAYHRI